MTNTPEQQQQQQQPAAGAESVKCHYCPRHFKNAHGRRVHMSAMHRYGCGRCFTHFHWPTLLQQHVLHSCTSRRPAPSPSPVPEEDEKATTKQRPEEKIDSKRPQEKENENEKEKENKAPAPPPPSCSKCKESFASEEESARHACRLVECALCSQQFSRGTIHRCASFSPPAGGPKKTDSATTKNETETEKEKEKFVIKCSCCGESFASKEEEAKHYCMTSTVSCGGCKKPIRHRDYGKHYSECFACPKCKSFVNRMKPVIHFCGQCSQCSLWFHNADDYARHQKICQCVDCGLCGRPFHYQGFGSHSVACSKCTECDIEFHNAAEKKAHFCYTCDSCGAKFKSKPSLEAHLSTCRCPFCNCLRSSASHDCGKAIAQSLEAEERKQKAELEEKMARKRRKLEEDVTRRQMERLKRRDSDIYELLAIPKTSPREKVKQAYRQKALQLHPDKSAGLSEIQKNFNQELLKRINITYGQFSRTA